jgi:hypothetical protein
VQNFTSYDSSENKDKALSKSGSTFSTPETIASNLYKTFQNSIVFSHKDFTSALKPPDASFISTISPLSPFLTSSNF